MAGWKEQAAPTSSAPRAITRERIPGIGGLLSEGGSQQHTAAVRGRGGGERGFAAGAGEQEDRGRAGERGGAHAVADPLQRRRPLAALVAIVELRVGDRTLLLDIARGAPGLPAEVGAARERRQAAGRDHGGGGGGAPPPRLGV